jgi:general secretion pathway protein F
MSTFRYRAVDRAGEIAEGTMEAASAPAVVWALQRRGYTPLSAEPLESSQKELAWRWLDRRRPQAALSLAEVGALTDELATLMLAGLTVDRALSIASSAAETDNARAIFDKLRHDVAEGHALSTAMRRQPTIFGPTYTSVIRAGETAGVLGAVMRRLAHHTLKMAALREQVVTALVYPALLVTVTGVSLIVILFVVLPKFEETFSQMDAPLPALTVGLMALGHFIRDYWWMVAGLLVAAAGWLQYRRRTPEFRQRLHAWCLSAPIIGRCLTSADTVRACRTLAVLLVNGAGLADGLALASDTVSNMAFSARLRAVNDDVKTGRRFADACERQACFPTQAVQMIRVGEETGELGAMLDKVAESFEHRLQTQLARAVALVEPALILTLAAVIAIVVLALLLAVLSLSDLPL